MLHILFYYFESALLNLFLFFLFTNQVRIAGKSHMQHTTGARAAEQVEIIEVPVDGNASCIAVCRLVPTHF